MIVTDFILIRHGQTKENIEGRLQGHFDGSLDETGIRQAHAVAARLAGEHAAVLYSSDLKRAYKTAEIIARNLQLPVRALRELREWHLGELENRLKNETAFCLEKRTKTVDKRGIKWYIITRKRKDESNVQVRAPAPEPVMQGRI